MKVYILWHVHTLEDDYGVHDDEKLLGVYSTKEKAESAINEYKDLEGFRDCPIECFEIDEHEVDRSSNWKDGFATVRYGK